MKPIYVLLICCVVIIICVVIYCVVKNERYESQAGESGPTEEQIEAAEEESANNQVEAANNAIADIAELEHNSLYDSQQAVHRWYYS